LLDQNRTLQAANERITQENKAMKERQVRPDGHRAFYGKTVGPSNAVGNFDALRQEMINKVSEEVGRGLDVVLSAVVNNGDDRRRAEIAEKKVTDLQGQLDSQSRAHAARVADERANVRADVNRMTANMSSLTKELEKTKSEASIAQGKSALERDTLRATVQILTTELDELQQKYTRDIRRLSGL